MTDPTVPQPEQPITPPSPADQPPVYEAPGYTTLGYAPTGPPTNPLSIVALVLGIVVPIGGIITGHIALGQIKRSGEAGHGLALAGTVIGYALSAVWILFWVFWFVFYVVLLGAAGSAGVFDPSHY
jgi:hypothetical protein